MEKKEAAVQTENEALDSAGDRAELVEVPLSPSQIEDLKAKAAKVDEYWDQLVRRAAEFDNYKKRASRERQEAIRYANETLLEKLVPLLDNFEMALAAANTAPAGSAESLRTGINLVYTQFKHILQDVGLEELDATGKVFDPAWQEAVSQVETDEAPEGQVVRQLRKGYKLRDRVIRPASVVVAKNPASLT